MIKEEAIEILSDMRAEYNIFSDDEEEATRYHALSWAIQALNEQQHTERKKGKWIKKMKVTKTEKYIAYDPEWYCPCCGTKYDPYMAKIVKFCYVCGEKMEVEE